MMPKSDTITEIMKHNPSADPTFLSEFSANDLDEYLGRLSSLNRAAGWGSNVAGGWGTSLADSAPRRTPMDQNGADAG